MLRPVELAFLILIFFGLCACGVKGDPLPPLPDTPQSSDTRETGWRPEPSPSPSPTR